MHRAVAGVEPEPIRTHLVELRGSVFPPKQVLAVVTGWPRESFTTMEAQRVLRRLGFTCRRADTAADLRPAWVQADEATPATAGVHRGPADLLVRDVPGDVLGVIETRAGRLGIPADEYVRRQLVRLATGTSEGVTAEDLRQFSSSFGDLDDPDVMGDAWRSTDG